MWQAFIIVLREGVEAFLIVAITLAYLRKTDQGALLKAVGWGVAASLAASALLGYMFWLAQGENQPLWEGVMALVTAVLVTVLVVHMWKIGPRLKQEMENRLAKETRKPTTGAAMAGVFLFTLLMITREGMETALLLFQIHEPRIVAGVFFGIFAATAVGYLWQQFGYLINLKHFFQVTAVYLLFFTVQILVQSFHEFTEAGIFPQSEALHIASEPFSTEGVYGKLFSTITTAGCGIWLVGLWIYERFTKSRPAVTPKISDPIQTD